MADMDTRLVRLAATARRSAAAAADARTARDEAIAEAEEGGWTLAAIAARTGLSLAHVGRIAVTQTGKRQQAEPPEND